jgi:hypothetical protein
MTGEMFRRRRTTAGEKLHSRIWATIYISISAEHLRKVCGGVSLSADAAPYRTTQPELHDTTRPELHDTTRPVLRDSTRPALHDGIPSRLEEMITSLS